MNRAVGEPTTVRDGGLGSAVALMEDTHVAVDEHDRAREGLLYTRRRLRRQQEFRGHLTGDPADVDAVVALGSTLWLGGRRSTAGRATLRHDPTAAPAAPEWLDEHTLVLRLAAPGLFADRRCRPRPEPSADELSAALGGVPARVTRRWVRWTQVTGWHAASGLPKPAEAAVAAGGTYLVQCDRAPDETALRTLAARGLGLRRAEGYGALGPGPDAVLGPLLTGTAG